MLKTVCKPFLGLILGIQCNLVWAASAIPLPEHPRPDFQRERWLNLNGDWEFQFDSENVGISEKWFAAPSPYTSSIQVPFSWGSPLSGVNDEADIGWYARVIEIPLDWEEDDIFVVLGACDWHTTVWLDGQKLGEHQGGYTPFEFKLSPALVPGQKHRLVLRVDDRPRSFKLEGKQGYGRAAGIWQTVYLEARPNLAIESVHFTPDIDQELVTVAVQLNRPAPIPMMFEIKFDPEDRAKSVIVHRVNSHALYFVLDVPMKNPHLWTLNDPFLYDVTVILKGGGILDEVSTYFGMRKIGTGHLPGTNWPYVTLNNKPVYLQMTLDQAFHPEGYYTYPSDEVLRDDLLKSRSIGLNGHRVHVKVPIPRKLYWADCLGLLIMSDVPNSWGEPDVDMQAETEYALRQMIKRDYNHPSIFAWVNFNETWGLKTKQEGKKVYLPQTQSWVEYMYQLTKQLDGSRLCEDNSPCLFDHVSTDLNSWHAYAPGYAWQEKLNEYCEQTFPASSWNFVKGGLQADQPMFNSECGNVWGYEGSTGDVDWSWDYHMMMNAFRRHTQCSGWIYTEHHDVINEWNGYWRYDRTPKETGFGEFVPSMSLRDLHSPVYLSLDTELCRAVGADKTISVPMFLSVLSDQSVGNKLILEASLYGWDSIGQKHHYWVGERSVVCRPWLQQELPPLQVEMPDAEGLCVLTTVLRTSLGQVLHRNFTTYLVSPPSPPLSSNNKDLHSIPFEPNSFTSAQWSEKQWNIPDGRKVNGAGFGFFEFRLPWPEHLDLEDIDQACLRLEASAKQLFGKDRADQPNINKNYMRGGGEHDPSRNPNAYPMTDQTTYPSSVRVRINGVSADVFELRDDPADHRGILSWFHQTRDGHLEEAGSYGYLIEAIIPDGSLEQAYESQEFCVRLEVDEALPGGLAIYGKEFGRYPLDPTLILSLHTSEPAIRHVDVEDY